MALGLTQPLTEMSTRNISWEVKAAGAYGWQPYYLHVPIVLKSGRLNLLKPSGPVQACNEIALPLPYTSHNSLCNVQSILQRVSTFRLKPPGRTHRGPQVNWYNLSECMWARRIKTFPTKHLIKVPKFCSILFLSWKGRCCEQIFYHV